MVRAKECIGSKDPKKSEEKNIFVKEYEVNKFG